MSQERVAAELANSAATTTMKSPSKAFNIYVSEWRAGSPIHLAITSAAGVELSV